MKIKPIALCLLTGIASTTAQADFVTWQLNNVVLSDGQTVQGSFDYDADINTYQNIAITTSGSVLAPAMSLDRVIPPYQSEWQAGFNDSASYVGDIYLRLAFSEALTNSGGIVDLIVTYTSGGYAAAMFECTQADCNRAISIPGVDFQSGYVEAPYTPSPVPLPAAAWLFSSALVGLAGVKRKA